MSYNRIENLIDLVNKLFGSDTHSVVADRYNRLSAEFLTQLGKAETSSKELSISKTIFKQPIAIHVGGYLDVLFEYAQKKRDIHQALKVFCGQGPDALPPCVFEMTVFFVESERMLNKASQARNKQDQVNKDIKAFFSNLINVRFFYQGALDAKEAATLLNLMSRVLKHRVLKLNEDALDQRFKSNFHMFSDQIICRTIDALVYNERLQDFVNALSTQKKNYFPTLMRRIKTLHERNAGSYISTLAQAETCNLAVARIVSLAKYARTLLPYDDVSWIRDIKTYDISEYKESSIPTVNFLIKVFFTTIGVGLCALYYLGQYHLVTNEELTTDERDSIKADMMIYRCLLIGLVGVAALYVTELSAKYQEMRVFILPSQSLKDHDIFDIPCQWGQAKIAESKVVQDEDHAQTGEADVIAPLFEDHAQTGKDEVIVPTDATPIDPPTTPTIALTDERKFEILKSAYSRFAKLVEKLNPHAETFFKSVPALVIRRNHMNLKEQAEFFENEKFNETAYRQSLLDLWNYFLPDDMKPFVGEAPKKVEPVVVPSAVVFSRKATELKEEVNAALRRHLRVNQLSTNNDICFMQSLHLRYDLLLICKALQRIESEDNNLYWTMVSKDSPENLSDFIRALKRDKFHPKNLLDVQDEFLNMMKAKVTLKLNPHGVKSREELEQKYSALCELIEQAKSTDPAHKKRAFIMAMIDIVVVSKQLGIHKDRPVDARYVRMATAFKDYESHKDMYKMSSLDLKSIMNEMIARETNPSTSQSSKNKV